eukprot:354800-Chlamydomonas_euryale.AAC.1
MGRSLASGTVWEGAWPQAQKAESVCEDGAACLTRTAQPFGQPDLYGPSDSLRSARACVRPAPAAGACAAQGSGQRVSTCVGRNQARGGDGGGAHGDQGSVPGARPRRVRAPICQTSLLLAFPHDTPPVRCPHLCGVPSCAVSPLVRCFQLRTPILCVHSVAGMRVRAQRGRRARACTAWQACACVHSVAGVHCCVCLLACAPPTHPEQ